MNVTYPGFPRPTPEALVLDDHLFVYQSHRRTGLGRLRVWTAEEGGFIAMITDGDMGRSAQNTAAEIWTHVTTKLGTNNVVFLDYTSDALGSALHWWWWEDDDHHTVSTIWTEDEPSPGTEPAKHKEWMRQHGQRLLTEGGDWNLPQHARAWFRHLINEGDITTLHQLAAGETSFN